MNQTPHNGESAPTVVLASDDIYATPLAVTVASMLSNFSGKQIRLIIADAGLRQDQRNRMREMATRFACNVDLIWAEPDPDRFPEGTDTGFGGISTYCRLLLPDLVPMSCAKIVYLDSDIIVEGNLADLWSKDLGDAIALAGRDFGHLTMSSANPELTAASRSVE